MSLVPIFLFGGIGLVVVVMILAIWGTKSSYKYPCIVAIPTGDSPDDVIYQQDKFKIKTVGGHLEIKLFKNKGKSYSPDYKFWGKWFKPGKAIPQKSEEGWAKIDDPDIRKHLIRGAMFYKVSEDEYHVMKINKVGDLNVLDQDSREIIIDDIEKQNEITTSFRDKLIQMGVWLGSLLLIGILAIVIIVLTMKYAGERSSEIIQLAQAAAAAQPGVGG